MYCSSCGKKYPNAETESDQNDIFQNIRSDRHKGSHRRIITAGVVMLLIAIVVVVLFALFRTNQKSPSIQNLADSCVRVCCYGGLDELTTIGSGFCVYDKNIVVTNYHVVKGVTNEIRLDTEDQRSFAVDKILAFDEKKDVCFLHFNDKDGLIPLEEGITQSIQKGDSVLAIGSPEGFLNTITEGKFSGWLQEDVGDVMQISAAISSGSSGGAVFDEQGNVIGQTYASYTEAEDINLAIPIETIREIWTSRSASDAIDINDFINEQISAITDDVVWIDDVLHEPEKYDSDYIKVAGYVSSVYFEKYEPDTYEFNRIILTLVPEPEMVLNKVIYADSEDDESYLQELKSDVEGTKDVAILGTFESDPSEVETGFISPGKLVIFESYVKHGKTTIWNFADQEDVEIMDCVYFTDHDANQDGLSRIGYNAKLYAINNIKKKDLKEFYGY